MNKLLIPGIIGVTLGFTACGGKKGASGENAVIKTERDSASYAAGLSEGERMQAMLEQSHADTLLNKDLFLAGFNDFMKGKGNTRMNKEAADRVLRSFFGKIQQSASAQHDAELERFKKQHAAEKEASEKWMADNKSKPGVTTTLSGLQYKVDKKGSGPVAKLGDVVKVHYTGTLTDGTLVDSSRDKDAFEFELQPQGLIQGWIEALQLMNKGSRITLYVPYDLGYGEMGKAPKVPPYSVLIFDLELVDLKAQ
ncbi:MAG TPA: FKBP-type peptidyl-prolyl cis-trans isomerase [Flavobacteriales bacterium]|nr:FKBP-type peptidyl-prolyl cis-trans isomerase [Flavobacteriales bacterium]